MTIGGLAIAIVVLVMVAASVTLLPALLAVVGPRVVSRRRRSSALPSATDARWARWAGHVTRHPWPYLLVGVFALLALAAPALALRIGIPDDGALPAELDPAPGVRPRGRGVRSRRQRSPDRRRRPDGRQRRPGSAARGRRRRPGDRVRQRAGRRRRRRGRHRRRVPDHRAAGRRHERHGRPAARPRSSPERSRAARRRRTSAARRRTSPTSGERVHERLPGVHRRRAGAVLPAAAPDLPLGAGAAQGGAAQPAEHRCGLRRDGHGLPVGLGRRADRPRVHRADRVVHPDVHVRDPVRAVHGLRGVPALPRPRGVRRRAPARGRRSCAGCRAPPGSSPRPPLIMVAVFLSFVLGADAGTKMFGLGLATADLHRRDGRPDGSGAGDHDAARATPTGGGAAAAAAGSPRQPISTYRSPTGRSTASVLPGGASGHCQFAS